MTPLKQRMIEDLQLHGMSESTQVAYVRSVRQLAEYYGKSPADVTEEELRYYLLYLKNTKRISASTFIVNLSGIKFFYRYTLKEPCPELEMLQPKKEKKLPVVLSRGEVERILGCIRRQHHYVCLSTIYACGLRISEGVSLKVSHIDSDRMVIHVHDGKGKKDRYVPLPESNLQMMRDYWVTHRNPVWIFPILAPRCSDPSTAPNHMSTSSVRQAFKLALLESGVQKEATVHTLRHSYATHLLEKGVSLRTIQAYLGHARLSTTAIYLHLTPTSEAPAIEAVNELVADLAW